MTLIEIDMYLVECYPGKRRTFYRSSGVSISSEVGGRPYYSR